MTKLASTITVLVVFCVLAVTSARERFPTKGETCDWFRRNHLQLGSVRRGEKFVLTKKLYKERVPSEKIELVETFTAPAGMVISRILAVNEKPDGQAGCGFLVSGGPGHNSVTLKFVSFVGQAINFTLNILAAPAKQ